MVWWVGGGSSGRGATRSAQAIPRPSPRQISVVYTTGYTGMDDRALRAIRIFHGPCCWFALDWAPLPDCGGLAPHGNMV